MSADATGWVYRHSPFRGATFQVHHAIADSMNDQHDNELWMAMGTLASKARVERKTATKAVADLLEAGFLVVIDDHREDRAGQPSRYGFVFMEGAPIIYETRKGGSSGRTPQGASSDRARVGSGDSGGGSPGPTNPRNPSSRTQEGTADDRNDPGYRFEDWWRSMPLRNGKRLKKREADVKWRRLPYETKALVFKATRNYAAACERGEQIAMDPYRFIGSTRRWEDWLEPAPPGQPQQRQAGRPDRNAGALRILDDLADRGLA